MKKFFLCFALAVVLGVGSLHALGSFEGQVDYKMTTKKGESIDMSYLLKGKKIRVNTQAKGQDGAMIMDLKTRKMIMLMPAQKMYMNMDMPETKGKEKNLKPEGKMTKTGKTEVILGKKCEEWLYEGKTGQASIWAVSGMGNFMGMNSKPGDSSNAWADAIKSKGLFPLRMVYSDKEGKKEMTMEATKIDERSLSASLFVPPADYKSMDMGGNNGMNDMIQQMMKKKQAEQ